MATPTPTSSPAPTPTATLSADQLFRVYFAAYPLDGVAYHEIQNVALSVCFDFDDGASAADILLLAVEHFADRSQEWIARLGQLIGAGVQAFCPEHSPKFEALAP